MFKLEEEQLVLAAGRTRWLSHATREVETVLEEIKKVELDRAIEVEGAAKELGLSSAPSLRAPTRCKRARAMTRWPSGRYEIESGRRDSNPRPSAWKADALAN